MKMQPCPKGLTEAREDFGDTASTNAVREQAVIVWLTYVTLLINVVKVNRQNVLICLNQKGTAVG